MFGSVVMLGGMLVLGAVATSHVPADQAHPKMYPTIAHLQALFTTFGLWFDVANLIGMRADFSHFAPPSFILVYFAA
jgi:hypothetical protein